MRRSIAAAATATAAAVTLSTAATALAPAAQAVDQVDTSRLRAAVTVNGILGHERVLQRIADENGGTRASGTPGFAASAAYVKRTLRAAGYGVTEQSFTFPFFRSLADPVLEQVSPTATTYETSVLDYSGSGDVTGRVVPTTDVVLPPTPVTSSTSGCQPGDFLPASPTAPEIALVQRGGCDFVVKADNARAAGYDAVVVFNEGQPGRTAVVEGTLGTATAVPVLGLSFADGAALYAAAQAGAVTLHAVTSTENDPARTTTNVIATSPGGDRDDVVVVGAHLDSVVAGPGINDDGSGVATDLEIAVQMAKLKIAPRQTVRFAFWGAEEEGLLGSQHYVDTLSDRALGRISANLNFDMLGSPNYARFVYDGDGSDSEAGPPGSGAIEQLFTQYLTSQGLASEPTEFDGRSDYGPFIAVGIPAGGLFSGAEGIKTEAQAQRYGGTAGQPYDACYHQACDTTTNLSTAALAELGDAAAHAVLTLAKSRTDLFGERSTTTAQRVAARSAAGARHLAVRSAAGTATG